MGLKSRRRTQSEAPRRRQALVSEKREQAQRQEFLFKRNRTLTGSTSSHVSALGELRADLTSPRVHAHKLALHRRRLGVLFACVVVASVCLVYILGQLTATVRVAASDIAIERQLDHAVYETAIDKYLADHPLERFRFALNLDALTAYMHEQHSEVAEIQQVSFGGELGESVFRIAFRTPVAGWKIGGTQLYVDSTGISFEKNYTTASIVQIVDNSGIDTSAGSAVASNRLLTFVGRVVAESQKAGIVVQEVVLPLDTTRQLELHIKDYASLVKLSVDRGVGEQVEDMSRAIQYFKARGEAPSYIDVRVSGKAFYK